MPEIANGRILIDGTKEDDFLFGEVRRFTIYMTNKYNIASIIYNIYNIYNIYTLQVTSSTGPVGTKLSNAARVAKSVSGQTELLWSGAGNGTQGQGADEIYTYRYLDV